MKIGTRVLDEDGREGIVIDLCQNHAGSPVAFVEYVASGAEELHTAWIAHDQLVELTLSQQHAD